MSSADDDFRKCRLLKSYDERCRWKANSYSKSFLLFLRNNDFLEKTLWTKDLLANSMKYATLKNIPNSLNSLSVLRVKGYLIVLSLALIFRPTANIVFT